MISIMMLIMIKYFDLVHSNIGLRLKLTDPFRKMLCWNNAEWNANGD